MNGFFLNGMAVANLASGEVERRPVPRSVADGGDPGVLAGLFPDALVFAVGRFTGTHAPASCLLTARVEGAPVFLKGRSGPALRFCGLDALVVRGCAAGPSGLVLDEQGGSLIPLDGRADVPATRAALLRETSERDSEPALIVTGPAAFLGSPAAAVCLETGLAPHTGSLAAAMAGRNLAGIGLNGGRPFLSPLPLDNPARTAVKPARVTSATLGAILAAALDGFSGKAVTVSGRSIACFGCPSPCGFWLPVPGGHVACTAPDGLAALLACGADARQAAAVLELSERFGVDPICLRGLARKAALPETAAACTTEAEMWGDPGPDAPFARLGAQWGVCPFFLKRYPELKAKLTACDAVSG